MIISYTSYVSRIGLIVLFNEIEDGDRYICVGHFENEQVLEQTHIFIRERKGYDQVFYYKDNLMLFSQHIDAFKIDNAEYIDLMRDKVAFKIIG
jgi:hypothetical protein